MAVRSSLFFVLFLALGAGPVVPVLAQSVTQIGTFKDWSAY